ncbi:phycoerythrobilin:ferredoxin oxidoreductase [Candidatus Cyanaurora vandensis]|uniref:phycoerythrobilin:ferredoxin oxidoreductase n=1 Tax=Candidatus Cyanaurora vandensis TaxID=2714958 RepID=UPI00257AAC3C|nr:phycoerythrobilin:ferredoxin oxidoreductase [Candidatus Cyanaurora vandensis]
MTLYQPFLDHALARFQERFDPTPFPIPVGFEQKQGVMRKEEVLTTSYAVKTPQIRQARAAHVQGGSSLQVLNFVVFPSLDLEVPFFGVDLVTLPGGHLIALDLQPVFQDPDYLERYYHDLQPVLARHQADLPWGGDFPEEAKPFFSPCFLWTRPQATALVETQVFAAFKDYLDYYLDLIAAARPVTDSERLAAIRQSHQRYVSYRAEKDPARGMFRRLYGEEWTEQYIHHFLFDHGPLLVPAG